ncbi:hypothetical protein QAD02_011699 [Eretmocerus hayati]|uniref:Uncharacterized protein n=1 Tax=Eretmocerus hayati TaxID=131215 RepID=A0ACC2NYG2_9HYME|nr:hypothetical protein QAD02_011699 [Eretmocerus hayati]
MVTLHIPFRSEDNEILADMKFNDIFDDPNMQTLIVTNRKEFEADLDFEATLEACRQLCRKREANDALKDQNIPDPAGVFPEADPFEALRNNLDSEVNSDLPLASLQKLSAIARKKENILPSDGFCALMRSANVMQKEICLHFINHISMNNRLQEPVQIFFTGPASTRK